MFCEVNISTGLHMGFVYILRSTKALQATLLAIWNHLAIDGISNNGQDLLEAITPYSCEVMFRRVSIDVEAG